MTIPYDENIGDFPVTSLERFEGCANIENINGKGFTVPKETRYYKVCFPNTEKTAFLVKEKAKTSYHYTVHSFFVICKLWLSDCIDLLDPADGDTLEAFGIETITPEEVVPRITGHKEFEDFDWYA